MMSPENLNSLANTENVKEDKAKFEYFKDGLKFSL